MPPRNSKMAKEEKTLKNALKKPKELDEIMGEQLEAALLEHRRGGMDVFLSAISGGLEVGFSVFLMGIIYTMFHGNITDAFLRLWLATSYSLGFIFVIIGRSQLFTEHTTLAVIPVLNKKASIKSLLILWGLVFSGNLVGGYIFSLILTKLPVAMGIVSEEALIHLANSMINYNWALILGSGVLAGWLMGLMSWLIASSNETISRIFVVILVGSVIGLGGLHHSVVGSIEVFNGFLLDKGIKFSDYLHFQIWTTLGNIIGGVVFVALIKFSFIAAENGKYRNHLTGTCMMIPFFSRHHHYVIMVRSQ